MGSEVNIRALPGPKARLGEGAFWDAEQGCLWWVDIVAGLVHRLKPDTQKTTTYDFGEPVGCVAPRLAGGLVVAAKSGFWHWLPETDMREHIGDPEANRPGNRFNDGATDPAGRFWAGTMKDGGEPDDIGAFYCLDNGEILPWRDGFFTTNGLAFSADGNQMYFSDSNQAVRTIWVANYDLETGHPGKPREFFDTRSVAGRPDGGTVDSDGFYWMAGVSGWQILRLSPQGMIDRIIELPVEKPTKPMFGGADLKTLYVTSIGMDVTSGTHQPDAGRLFEITGLDVQGVTQHYYRG